MVTPPYVDVGIGKLVVVFAAPIVGDGELIRVVSGDVAMGSVVANVRSIHATPAGFGVLIDRSPIVATADAKLTLRPATDVASELTMGAIDAASD